MDNDDLNYIQSKGKPISFLYGDDNTERDDQEELKSLDKLEVKEVSEVIQSYYNYHSNLKESQGFSIKNFDWLSSLFNEADIKNNFIQRDTIKKVLINQALYFLTLFYTLYSRRQKEAFTKKSTTVLPMISDTKKIPSTQSMNPSIKIGLIGCGNIGGALLKNLITIKDRSLMPFKLYVSTRRPEKVKQDFLHCLDESIEICLNNELIFSECDIIFLCIQPHQLALLAKDVKNSLEEKIDKLNKKKTKVYPMLISFLSATPLERLRLFFNENLVILRTCLDHRQMYLKRIEVSTEDINQGSSSTIEKFNNLWDSKRTYIKESGDHLIQKSNMEMIEKMIGMFIREFYTSLDKGKNSKEGVTNTNLNTNLSNSFDKRKNVFPLEKVPEPILRTLMNKSAFEKYKNEYNIVAMKYKETVNMKDVLEEITKKYNKHLSRLINFDE